MQKQGGGVVYVPGGTYSLYSSLEVPAGVELRGSASVATRDQNSDCAGTLFLCYYGDEGGEINSTAFVTLTGENAGLNGVRIIYADNGPVKTDTNTNIETTYAVRGKASGVYVVNSMISAAAYGVDFRNCDNHYLKGVVTCCYYNAYYLGGIGGTITDCLQNGTVLTRTAAPVDSHSWTGTSANDMAKNLYYPILKRYCHYIILENAENELVYNISAYGVMTMLTNIDSTNTLLVNLETDKVGASSAQIVMDGGSLLGVNILRCNTTTAEATDNEKDGKYLTHGVGSKAYKYLEGDLELHNRLVLRSDSMTVSNEPAITPTNAASVWILTCDSKKGLHTEDTVFEVTNEEKYVKQGTGAYIKQGRATERLAVQTEITVDASIYKNGKLHLWFYVNDVDYLASWSDLTIELGKTNANALTWKRSLNTLKDGWNELELDLSLANGYSDFDFSAINYLEIYQGTGSSYLQNSALVTVVDDVRIIPGAETDSTQKVLIDCDTEDTDLNITTSGTFEVTNVSGEYTEGTGAFKTSGKVNERIIMFMDTPINIASYEEGKLCLDFYINSKSNFTNAEGLRIEIGSSRRADCEELQWNISLDELKDGWNHIELNISEGATMKDKIIHLGAVDYFRIYHTGTSNELITILDNVYVTRD